MDVDGSAISKISKFNYLLGLVKGKPRQDILSLKHTEGRYDEAKKIMNDIYMASLLRSTNNLLKKSRF